MRSVTMRELIKATGTKTRHEAIQKVATLLESHEWDFDGEGGFHFAGLDWEKDFILFNRFTPGETGGVWHHSWKPPISFVLPHLNQ
jgi:hypothetical protein